MLPVSFGDIQRVSATQEDQGRLLGYDDTKGEVCAVDTTEASSSWSVWGIVTSIWHGSSDENNGSTNNDPRLPYMKKALGDGMDSYDELTALTGETKLAERQITRAMIDKEDSISAGVARAISETVMNTKTGRLLEAATQAKRFLTRLDPPDVEKVKKRVEELMRELFAAAREAIQDEQQLNSYITKTFKDEIRAIHESNPDNTFDAWILMRHWIGVFNPEQLTPPSAPPVTKQQKLTESEGDMADTLTDETIRNATVRQISQELLLDEDQVQSLGPRTLTILNRQRDKLTQSLKPDALAHHCPVQSLKPAELRSLGLSSVLQDPGELPGGISPDTLSLAPRSLQSLLLSVSQPICDDRPVSYTSDGSGEPDIEGVLDEIIDENEGLQLDTVQDEALVMQSIRSRLEQQNLPPESLFHSPSPEPQPSPLELQNPGESFVRLRTRLGLVSGERPSLTRLRQREALEVPTLHPLTLNQRKELRKTWDTEFEKIHGISVSKLPAYEQRHLENSFYHGCHKDNKPATTEQMREVIAQHSPIADRYMSHLAEQLRQHKPGTALCTAGSLDNPLQEVAKKLGMEGSHIKQLSKVCSRVQHEAIALLSSSCYDGQKTLEPNLAWTDKLAKDINQELRQLNALYAHLMNNTDNAKAGELTAAMIHDLNITYAALNNHVQHLQIMKAHDFSRDAQLRRSEELLLISAIQTMRTTYAELNEQLANPTEGNQQRLEIALSDAEIALAKFQDELDALRDRPASGKVQEDIVGKARRSQKKITKTLAKVGVSKGAFKKGMKKAMQEKQWPILRSQMVMRHNGNFRTFDVEMTPGGACVWDPEKGLASSDAPQGKDVLKLDGKGFSSLDKDERQHAINAWVVRVTDPETNETVMTKVRSGVPVPFTMIAAMEPEDAIIEATCNRMRETIALMVLNNPKYWDHINAGRTIDFKAVHNSLLSPDQVRSFLNNLANVGGKTLHKVVGNTLEDETQMNRYIQAAIEKLNREELSLEIRDQDGNPKTVQVRYEGIMFACPANSMGQSGLYSVWDECDPINKAAAEKMFGGTDPGKPLGGIVGNCLSQIRRPKEEDLVERAARQIQFILHKELHKKNQYMAVQLASLINTISQYVVDGNHDFCKSGKDRTGYVNMLCIVNHLDAYLSGYLLPALDAPVTMEQHQNRQCGMACTGQIDLIAENFCIPGAKVNDPAGIKDVFHRAHHDSKKHSKLIGQK